MGNGFLIRDVSVSYNGNNVLKKINLEIAPGRITAVMGPSGCGKTTLLRSLNRLSELTRNCKVSGDIFLGQEEIHHMDPIQLRRRVGMVFQKPNPFPMSIRENVLYGVKAAKLKVDEEEIVKTSLTRAAIYEEIRERLKDNAFGLSVGQQQRVCIARTLAMSPEVILMDEPAASLDPSSAAKVEASIRSMKGDYTVVIVTHNMQQAMRVADYAVFMYLGEIVEAGEASQLFENPHHEETREFIAGRFG
jgi:phosphate transport system ATP-binding protein